MPLLFTPDARRKERPHGQGVITYGEANVLLLQQMSPQAAPDPIRQGDTPARPARRQIAVMSTRPKDWGYGIAPDFIPYNRLLTRRLMPAGRILNVRAQNTVGTRPNITRPTTVAYGSLFSLSAQNYDLPEVAR